MVIGGKCDLVGSCYVKNVSQSSANPWASWGARLTDKNLYTSPNFISLSLSLTLSRPSCYLAYTCEILGLLAPLGLLLGTRFSLPFSMELACLRLAATGSFPSIGTLFLFSRIVAICTNVSK